MKLAIVWAMLIGFGLLNTAGVWRLVAERKQPKLGWIAVVCSVLPLIIFGATRNPVAALLSFVLLQSVGMLSIQKILGSGR